METPAESQGTMMVAGDLQIVQPSDGGQSSTASLEHQLDNLQILLAQAETEVGGSTPQAINRTTSEDMAELSCILEESNLSSSSTRDNILHSTTPENILDVLGLSKETIKKPFRKTPVAASRQLQQKEKEEKVSSHDEKEEKASAEPDPAVQPWRVEDAIVSSHDEKEENASAEPDPAVQPGRVEDAIEVSSEPDAVLPWHVEDAIEVPSEPDAAVQPCLVEDEIEVPSEPDATVQPRCMEDIVEVPSEPDATVQPGCVEDVVEVPSEPDASVQHVEHDAELPSEPDATVQPWCMEDAVEVPCPADKKKDSSDILREALALAESATDVAVELNPPANEAALESPNLEEKNKEEDSLPVQHAVLDVEQPDALQELVDALNEDTEKVAIAQPDPNADSAEEFEFVVEDYANAQLGGEKTSETHPTAENEMPKEEALLDAGEDGPAKSEEGITEQEKPVPEVEEITEQEKQVEDGEEKPEKKRETSEMENPTVALEEEKKEEDPINVLVLQESESLVGERKEFGPVEQLELLLSNKDVHETSDGENVETNEESNETSAIEAPDAIDTSLPLVFEARYITAATSDTIVYNQSAKLLCDLKHEVGKLKSAYKAVEDSNKLLSQAHSSTEASFESLNEHVQQLQKELQESQADVNEASTALADSKTLVVELRNELSVHKAMYEAEAQSRQRHQKALGEMADLVKEKCTDSALVEKVLSILEKVNEEAVAVPEMKASSETETDTNSVASETLSNAEKGTDEGGYMSYFKACVWTT